MVYGLLAYDIFKSSLINSVSSSKPVRDIFEEFHKCVGEIIKKFDGKEFSTQGDCKIFYFDNVNGAIHAGIYMLSQKIIEGFNKKYSEFLNLPIYIRLGVNVTKDELNSVPKDKRGTYKSNDLDILGHLISLSPPMRLTLTENAFKEASDVLKPLFRPGTKIQKYSSIPPILTYVNKGVLPNLYLISGNI